MRQIFNWYFHTPERSLNVLVKFLKRLIYSFFLVILSYICYVMVM